MANPYLSIVAASRNDQHGGDILKRMTLFVNGLIAQSNRHNIQVELVMIEWNPDASKPLLKDVLPRPAKNDKLTLRYIIVPPEIHHRYKQSKDIPIFQMIAKNVGIRRAKGEFVLCTNVDLIFSDPLFRTLALKKLRKDTYYRANRCDVTDGINTEWDFDKQLSWCNKNIVRRLGMDPRFKHINLEQLGLNNKSHYKKWIFDKMSMVMKRTWQPEKKKYYQLDSFACGDFTLMAYESWIDIQGYLELDLYAHHIDTLGIMAAACLGYKQHTFSRDACTYHIEHTEGWETMPPLEKIKFLEKRPSIDYAMVYQTGMYVLRKEQHFNVNPGNWGFSEIVFEEHVFPK